MSSSKILFAPTHKCLGFFRVEWARPTSMHPLELRSTWGRRRTDRPELKWWKSMVMGTKRSEPGLSLEISQVQFQTITIKQVSQ